ncbi:MAG: ATPase, T2SS/T4P/T4SS family [bacterium]
MLKPEKQKQLLDFLLSKNLLKPTDIKELETEIAAGKNIDDLLQAKHIIGQEELVKAKAEFLGLKYIDLTEQEISESILNIIPVEVAENYKVICFSKEGKSIAIGMVDPNDFRAMEALDFLANKQGLQIDYYFISVNSFNNIFRQYKKFSKEISSALKSKEQEEKAEQDEGGREKLEDINFDEIVKNAPVAKIVFEIIKHAVEAGASDIHIEPMANETRVRYRVDGILHSFLTLPKNIHESVISRIKVLSKLKLDETRIPQGGRIRMMINNQDIDFRVSALPLMGEEKIVLRILDTSKGVLTMEQLGFAGTNLEIIKKNVEKTGGIILVTGPTGSGKSTTLYSMLHVLNKEGVNIVTLEDPVEYFMSGVNQSQIRPEIGFTFASGLRSLLRQDPDIMMVGEIRDNETAELAIHAALTGHLVLSTLHTNDAIGAVPRLLDMKIEPFLLGSVMNMVIAQRLARRLCDHCKKAAQFSAKVMAEIKQQVEAIPKEIMAKNIPNFDWSKTIIYEPEGCIRCGHTGFKSRVSLSEVLNVDQHIRDVIINKGGQLTIDEVRKNQSFITVEQDGLIKVCLGLTTIEEVKRVMQT